MTGDTVDRHDRALAVQRFGQPACGHLGPALLVDADIDRIGAGDFGVGGDHEDAGICRFGKDRVKGRRAVRVDDDRVDTLADEVPHMGDLAGHVDVGALHLGGDGDALVGPGFRGLFGFGDHLGAPFGADPAIGQTDGEFFCMGDRCGGPKQRHHRCRLDELGHSTLPDVLPRPRVFRLW